MPPVPNPRNGFVPRPGQMCRVVGACHPRLLAKVVVVTLVDEDDDSFECVYFDKGLDVYAHAGGELGGLEPLEANGGPEPDAPRPA